MRKVRALHDCYRLNRPYEVGSSWLAKQLSEPAEMTTPRKIKQIISLEQRLFEQIKKTRDEAQKLPPGEQRDALLQKVQEMETASVFHEILGKPRA
jgi:hypothetical protein